MKILMSTDAVGGVWSYAVELRAALATRGIEVQLAALGPEPPPERGIPYLRCRLEWQHDPWIDVERSGAWLVEMAEEIGANVVHLNGYAHAGRDWPAPTLAVAHSCLLSWHEAVRGGPTPPEWRRYRTKVRHGLSAADGVIAPTRAMLERMRTIYSLPGLGAVIHNGISPTPRAACERSPTVLAAGRFWDQAKGLEALAGAAAELPWEVELAGDAGECRPAGVTLLGRMAREQLRVRMARAAVFAHPARYEPFGLAPLEAAGGGCALVLGDIPTLRELWDGAALFVAPGSPRELAAAVRRLMEDERERRRLAELAVRRARRYSAARMAQAYATTYASLQQRRMAVA